MIRNRLRVVRVIWRIDGWDEGGLACLDASYNDCCLLVTTNIVWAGFWARLTDGLLVEELLLYRLKCIKIPYLSNNYRYL